MITLEIRKKSNAIWWHKFYKNGTLLNVKTSGKFTFSLDGTSIVLFSLIETNQVSTDQVDINNITIFDDTNAGLQYVFGNREQFEVSLQTLGYSGYKSNGVLQSATLPLSGTEEIAIVQGGETKKVSKSNLGFISQLLRITTPSSPITGTVAETMLYKWEIPANTFQANDYFKIENLRVATTGASSSTNIRIRHSTNSVFSSSHNLLATASFTGQVTDRMISIDRRVSINSGSLKVFSSANAVTDGSTSAIVTSSFDHTIINYIYFSIEPGATSNVMYLMNLIINR